MGKTRAALAVRKHLGFALAEGTLSFGPNLRTRTHLHISCKSHKPKVDIIK